jgi:BirA family biotin operon repressor/biotin-[acetyl-CoA-carboxylase] ligase
VTPDKLYADELSEGLKNKILGKRIYSYETLDSTNDSVFHLGEQNLPEGTCVFAEFQKKGKGRLGRAWESPRGRSLLFSVLLRPRLTPTEVPKMTLTAAVSVVKVARRVYKIPLEIKWPNDLIYRRKKIGGILTEMSVEADRVNFIVLGIGLNVNAKAKELPAGASSFREIGRKKIRRVELAQHILRQLETDYLAFKHGKFEALAESWEEFSATSGRRVIATVLGRKVHGQASGIDPDGALWIRKDSGLQERILAGDVEHVR